MTLTHKLDAIEAGLSGVMAGLDEEAIVALIHKHFPWQSYPQVMAALTYEKSVPLFPQATYDVPKHSTIAFVREIEQSGTLDPQTIASWLAYTRELEARCKRLTEALEWIRTIADANFGQDEKLRAQGARTLKRIAGRCDAALSQPIGEAGE